MFLAWRSLVCLTLTVVEHKDQRPQKWRQIKTEDLVVFLEKYSSKDNIILCVGL